MSGITPIDSYSEGAGAPPVWVRPDPALAAAGIEGEMVVAWVRVLAMALLMISPTLSLINEPGRPMHVTGFFVTLAASIAALAIWIMLRRGRWRPWIGFASSAFDVSMVSAALVTFLVVSSPIAALNSNVTFEMYFLAILATSLRYDARICIVVGALAVVEYGGLWLYSGVKYQLHDPSLAVGFAPYAPIDLFTRLILLGIATLLAVTIVRRAQRLLYLASRDRLTGLFNRGHFDRALATAMATASRDGQPLSLAILDLDEFKRINDQYGHALGDRALIQLADRLLRAMRRTDLVARYGGEEFVILMPGTLREAALVRMEALRQEVSLVPLDVGAPQPLAINFSAGVAGIPADGDSATDPKALLSVADSRLLVAKRTGRGRCIGADEAAVQMVGVGD
ncbi:MAG TPA: GGDEF domain-containing protein, partial [Gemmatimonadales bacterium]|nr:GGDEF domain-containing protein [Gemmatimonadales bacterium]